MKHLKFKLHKALPDTQVLEPQQVVRKLPDLPVIDLPDIIASGNKSEQEETLRDGCS